MEAIKKKRIGEGKERGGEKKVSTFGRRGGEGGVKSSYYTGEDSKYTEGESETIGKSTWGGEERKLGNSGIYETKGKEKRKSKTKNQKTTPFVGQSSPEGNQKGGDGGE